MMKKKLTPEQVKEEFEKCQKSKAYFYNNYCRKEGMPEYSEEEFDKYINTVKAMRYGQRLGDHKMKLYLKSYPMTPNDIFHVYVAGIDPYDTMIKTPKGSMGFNYDEWKAEQDFNNNNH